MIKGIHHISAITNNSQKNYHFYKNILGLRFIKKTVNFDMPYVYHLYFGDYEGTPGTALTFFEYPNAGTGMRGIGQVTAISFSVPKISLGFWLERFVQKGVKHSAISKRFGESLITFYDPDGLQLELIGTDEKIKETDKREFKDIPRENLITSFYSATLSIGDIEPTQKVLELLDYEEIKRDGFYTRFKNKNTDFATYIDILEMRGWVDAIEASGTVHHIAFSIDEENQKEMISKLKKHGLSPTEQIDRNYFKSVYFREPNGILFEIATLTPGFSIDEKLEELGTNLKLPAQYESQRENIESILPELETDEDISSSEKPQNEFSYIHKFIKSKNKKTLILFHGTGGDENDLLDFVHDLQLDFSFLSLRGKVEESGMNRFFERYTDGSFNQEDIKFRSREISEFLKKASEQYKFDLDQAVLLGFSNGANVIASMLLLGGLKNDAILLRPTFPIEPVSDLDLKDSKILILSGKNDPYAEPEKVEKLKDAFKKAGAKVESIITGVGHMIEESDVEEILEFLRRLG